MIKKFLLSPASYYVEIPGANLRVLCGSPADAVKHLNNRGHIVPIEKDGVVYETGPNAILLSDSIVQNGEVSNLTEFPVLQMLYRQGMGVPNHPGNNGQKPILIGSHQMIQTQVNYLHRGNYGLLSEIEMVAAGVSVDLARTLMREKLFFAFGQIRATEELFQLVPMDRKQIVINGASFERLAPNIFKISYRKEDVVVDLNIKGTSKYESPYKLSDFNIDRGYFSVLHSGDGDGWDVSRPAMSSIVLY